MNPRAPATTYDPVADIDQYLTKKTKEWDAKQLNLHRLNRIRVMQLFIVNILDYRSKNASHWNSVESTELLSQLHADRPLDDKLRFISDYTKDPINKNKNLYTAIVIAEANLKSYLMDMSKPSATISVYGTFSSHAPAKAVGNTAETAPAEAQGYASGACVIV